jgi:lysozyme family protein
MHVDALIDEIIQREGGFVDHPSDRGGPTKYGITKGTLYRWREQPVTTADVRNLDESEARDIYRAQYIEQPGFASLPEPLRTHVVDFGVNAGPAQSVRTLQRALGNVTVDGVLGPETRRAIEAADRVVLVRHFWQERIRYYGHLVAVRPNQAVFLDGWLNRCFGMWPA